MRLVKKAKTTFTVKKLRAPRIILETNRQAYEIDLFASTNVKDTESFYIELQNEVSRCVGPSWDSEGGDLTQDAEGYRKEWYRLTKDNQGKRTRIDMSRWSYPNANWFGVSLSVGKW